jgi:hypothetical protein
MIEPLILITASRTGNFTILVGIGSVPPPTMHESESTANLSEQHDKQKKQSICKR